MGSDTEVANLGIRIGSRHVYSLLMVGSYPHDDLGRWSSGFGIGGHIPLSRRFFLNVDFITRQVGYTDESEEGTWRYDEDTDLNKLRLAFGWEQHKWFSVFGGVSLNFSSRIDGTLRILVTDLTTYTEKMIRRFVFGPDSLRAFSFEFGLSRMLYRIDCPLLAAFFWTMFPFFILSPNLLVLYQAMGCH